MYGKTFATINCPCASPKSLVSLSNASTFRSSTSQHQRGVITPIPSILRSPRLAQRLIRCVLTGCTPGVCYERTTMSYLAIGAVTKAIAELLTKKLNKPPLMGETATFRVTVLPPDDERVSEDTGINLFLYKVGESTFLKNMDWRGDHPNPVKGNRPPLALTLSYLVTSYAKKVANSAQDDVTAHQLLGNAMSILHENSVLDDIHDSDFDADIDTQFAPELRNSFEKIKISLLPISMEEFSKIWTGLSKAYRLSVAYDVSLVQIGPTAPVPLPAPAVQTPKVQLAVFQSPVIISIEPVSGPAATTVTIRGTGLTRPGASTLVTVGGDEFSAADFALLTAEEIQLTVPEAPPRGPRLPIVISIGGQESTPAFYEVRPWIDSIQPMRGVTGIPVTIPFEIPLGATVSAEIDGQAVVAALDVANKSVSVVIPTDITTNGPKAVVLIVNDGNLHRSNARFFEVLPLIQSAAIVTQATPARTTITLNGERLKGADVSVVVGGITLRKGKNDTTDQLVVQVDRILATDLPVYAIVDGRRSSTLPSILDRIEPRRGFAGDAITIVGRGLSGRSVVVSFDTIALPAVAQPFTSQFAVGVPLALTAGVVQVKVTVDGRDTNSLPFTISG